MGVSLYNLHVPCAFGGRAGCDVNTSHVSPYSVLVTITFLGSRAREGGASARANCEPGFSSTQWSSPHYQVQGCVPSCWTEATRVWSKLVLFFRYAFSPLPAPPFLLQKGAVLAEKGPTVSWHVT